ncbi:MAG: histidinol-phosphate transaminase [Pseudomonadota bacterium]
MSASRIGSASAGISRRRFLHAGAAAAGALTLAERTAIAEVMVGGTSGLTVEDIRGWGETPGVVDIGDNENPYGPSPMAVRAVADRLLDVNRYDFGSPRDLANAIGAYHGLPEPEPVTNRFAPSNYPVHVEAGSSFILNVVANRFGIRNGRGEIIEAEPAYGGITRFVDEYQRRFGGRVSVKRVPTTASFQHDLDAMRDAVSNRTTLVVITNPNNPTGTIVPQAALESFVQSLPSRVMVLIDEAYIDFVREEEYGNSIALAQQYENVIVSRTFSKIYGLAGLRIGYAIASRALVDELRFFGNSYGIGSVNASAAIAALDDRAFVRHVLRMTNQVKDFFYAELDRLGLDYVPSHSSFVLVNAGQDGAALAQRMAERNILLSRLGMDGNARMTNYVRFSMGTPEELQVTVDALEEELTA